MTLLNRNYRPITAHIMNHIMCSLIVCVLSLLPWFQASSFASSQSDSLTLLLKTAHGEQRFDILKALARLYKRNNPEKSLAYAKEALSVAIDAKNRALQAEALNEAAVPLMLMQQNSKAIELLLESLPILDSLGDKIGYARTMNNLGIAYSQNESNENALKCYLSVLPYFESVGDSAKTGLVFMNLGLLYERLKKYPEALRTSYKALDIFTALGDKQKISDVSVNLGLIYTSSGNFSKADSFLLKAVEYYRTTGNKFGLTVALNNVAKMYLAKKDYVQAKRWFEQILPMIRELNNHWAEASVYLDLATISSDQGKWSEALQLLESASHLNSPSDDPSLQSQIYFAKYRIYDTIGNAGKALEYYEKYTTLHDTLVALKKSRMIEELSIQFKVSQKEAENKILRQDIKSARITQWIISIASLVIILASVLLIIILNLKRRNLRLVKEQVEKEKLLREAELEKNVALGKFREEENEKLLMEVQLKEQELVFKSMQKLELSNLNKSFSDQLSPFQFKIANKKDQADFVQVLNRISKDSVKESLLDCELLLTQMHKSFYEKLITLCPDLSKSELQVCALLRTNLSTKDIARLLNITVGSVDMTRHRIRQKLNLDQGQNLSAYLIRL